MFGAKLSGSVCVAGAGFYVCCSAVNVLGFGEVDCFAVAGSVFRVSGCVAVAMFGVRFAQTAKLLLQHITTAFWVHQD